MRFSLVIFIFGISTCYSFSSIRFTKVECSVSGFGTCIHPFCYVKSYNRSLSTINFGCDLTRVLTTVYVQITSYYRRITTFRQIANSKPVEWCSLMRNVSKNSYFNVLTKWISENYPKLLQQCPYKGDDFKAYNMTMNGEDYKFWPSGEYKSVYVISDDNDSKIFKISDYHTLTSVEKDDF